jgi:hypothetical protein
MNILPKALLISTKITHFEWQWLNNEIFISSSGLLGHNPQRSET